MFSAEIHCVEWPYKHLLCCFFNKTCCIFDPNWTLACFRFKIIMTRPWATMSCTSIQSLLKDKLIFVVTNILMLATIIQVIHFLRQYHETSRGYLIQRSHSISFFNPFSDSLVYPRIIHIQFVKRSWYWLHDLEWTGTAVADSDQLVLMSFTGDSVSCVPTGYLGSMSSKSATT